MKKFFEYSSYILFTLYFILRLALYAVTILALPFALIFGGDQWRNAKPTNTINELYKRKY